MHKIGVFDSGIGGKSVAAALEQAFPDTQIVFRYDAEHFPYATKSPEEILGFVLPILQQLESEGCQLIVIACNTVSTTLIGTLRKKLHIPLIAIEPMIKPAAETTKSNIVAVCATPTTLSSPRYKELKRTFASPVKVIEPDCSNWSELIENNQMNRQRIESALRPALQAGADVIVLGCTHYHWIEQEINDIVGDDVIVLQPETAIAKQVSRYL